MKLAEFVLSEEEARISSNALDFIMCADNYTHCDSLVCHNNAFNAAEKVDAGNFSFSRSEVKAIIIAIDYSLQHMNDASEITSHIEEDFPGIITALQESVPVLQALRVRLSAFSAKLSRRK